MKKVFLLAGLIITTAGAYAQTISYGVKAGLNLSKLTSSGNGGSVSSETLAGFHLGGIVDFKFQSFSIQPGILFSTKGGSTSVTSSGTNGGIFTGSISAKTTLDYIEVPVNFLYRSVAGNGNIFIGAGPYIAFGVSGKSTLDTNINGQPDHQSENVKFGSADGEIKNPDFGINALAGYQLNNGFAISAGYGLGLTNLSNKDNSKVKNQGFNFSLGYFFK